MDLKITAEWLQSFGDDDYEPSGLMTPRDRAELERRKAKRQAEGEAVLPLSEHERELERATAAAK